MMELKESDFEEFKKEAKRWIDLFGLKDWKVEYAFSELEDAYAQYSLQWQGKIALITLNKYPAKESSDYINVKRTAFHEVCELLLADMEYIALDEEIPYSERKGLTEAARHGVIRRLENSVFLMS